MLYTVPAVRVEVGEVRQELRVVSAATRKLAGSRSGSGPERDSNTGARRQSDAGNDSRERDVISSGTPPGPVRSGSSRKPQAAKWDENVRDPDVNSPRKSAGNQKPTRLQSSVSFREQEEQDAADGSFNVGVSGPTPRGPCSVCHKSTRGCTACGLAVCPTCNPLAPQAFAQMLHMTAS
eukprot:2341129-Rhodomonas_salina.2